MDLTIVSLVASVISIIIGLIAIAIDIKTMKQIRDDVKIHDDMAQFLIEAKQTLEEIRTKSTQTRNRNDFEIEGKPK